MNTEINNLKRQRQRVRDELSAIWPQKEAIDRRCDELANKIEDLNMRIAVAHALTPNGKPVRLEMVNGNGEAI